ncbi:MAG: PLP-dependent cysteine synthase family protein, partial [Polyangiales bacterium]
MSNESIHSARVFESLHDLTGGTPMVRLRRVDAIDDSTEGADEPESRRAVIWAKCEHLGPSGSLADRAARAMIDRAVTEGRLAAGATIVVPTSGNFGVAVAMACVSRGHRVVVAMPSTTSLERRQLLEAFGAELVLTEPERQLDGAIAETDRLLAELEGAVRLSPFDDDANVDAHEGTAREIVAALAQRDVERVAAFVAGVGSGGTVSGVANAFRSEKYSAFCDRIIAVEPARSATISRGERGPTKLQGLGVGFVPATYR